MSEAQDNLYRLAEMATAQRMGVSLDEIEREFDVTRRTAQRMTTRLMTRFIGVETTVDDEGRKRWKLPKDDLRLLAAQGLGDAELAAMDMAIRRAEREGAPDQARSLRAVRDKLLALMPGAHARRAETDAEALLEAWGFASRPGPRVRADDVLLRTIAEALKLPCRLTVDYRGARDDAARRRSLEPHGLILGVRQYLVAREAGTDGPMRQFRLDRIAAAKLDMTGFARDPDFDLARHAARAFGSFHRDAEYGEVVWRFAPRAAEVARAFVFHPDQTTEDGPDGSLTVRFRAAGHVEMAWHLYQWGDAVEVLAPDALRRMVEGHRRDDIDALP